MIFTSGLIFPEGPVALPDGSWLCVEMGSARGVVHIDSDGKAVHLLAKTGRPNGLAIDRDGTIWVAETLHPALLRLHMDGSFDAFLTKNAVGHTFLWPNDLAFGPDGMLYMTDSGISPNLFDPDHRTLERGAGLDYDGRIYQVDTHTGHVRLVDRELLFANGVAIGPDGNLYASETLTGNIYRYELNSGDFGPREYFGCALESDNPEGFVGPDGMKFGADGNLYVAVYGQGDVTVLGPDGLVVKRIPTQGKCPTNLAFRPGEKKIYVTEAAHGSIEAIDVDTEGLALFD